MLKLLIVFVAIAALLGLMYTAILHAPKTVFGLLGKATVLSVGAICVMCLIVMLF